jgi:hypothetical protein
MVIQTIKTKLNCTSKISNYVMEIQDFNQVLFQRTSGRMQLVVSKELAQAFKESVGQFFIRINIIIQNNTYVDRKLII